MAVQADVIAGDERGRLPCARCQFLGTGGFTSVGEHLDPAGVRSSIDGTPDITQAHASNKKRCQTTFSAVKNVV
jgi:hypothetical protein